MSNAKHIATYPLYGTNPITGQVNTRKRVGTGYIYRPEQIENERNRLSRYGHPMRVKWRNEDCRREFLGWVFARPPLHAEGE